MKFPLPADTFPTLLLSPEDKRAIEAVAEEVVQSTFDKYYEHMTLHNGVVDERRWRKFRKGRDLQVYKARKPKDYNRVRREDSASLSSSASSKSSSAPTMGKGEVEVMAPMLVVGSIPGNLDDIMYSVLSPSPMEMQLRSAYMGDGFGDWGLLSSITKPSETDPFRELSLKWFIKAAPMVISPIMRARDAVYIDSVGIKEAPNGERIGYHLYHSVEIPEIRELTDLSSGVVRGKLSVCELYRQRTSSTVEVYEVGMFSPMGDAPASLTAIMTSEVVVAMYKHAECAEMKKLTRVLLSSQQMSGQSTAARFSFDAPLSISDLRASTSYATGSTACGLCSQSVGSGLSFARSKEKHCRICSARLCSRCRVQKTVYLPTSVEKQISSTKMAFCTRCIHTATSASAITFAQLDVLVSEGKSVDYTDILR